MPGNTNRPYTEAEDQVLRDNVGEKSMPEVGRMLGRSPDSVKNRAVILNLGNYGLAINQDTAAERIIRETTARFGEHYAKIADKHGWMVRHKYSGSAAA